MQFAFPQFRRASTDATYTQPPQKSLLELVIEAKGRLGLVPQRKAPKRHTTQLTQFSDSDEEREEKKEGGSCGDAAVVPSDAVLTTRTAWVPPAYLLDFFFSGGFLSAFLALHNIVSSRAATALAPPLLCVRDAELHPFVEERLCAVLLESAQRSSSASPLQWTSMRGEDGSRGGGNGFYGGRGGRGGFRGGRGGRGGRGARRMTNGRHFEDDASFGGAGDVHAATFFEKGNSGLPWRSETEWNAVGYGGDSLVEAAALRGSASPLKPSPDVLEDGEQAAVDSGDKELSVAQRVPFRGLQQVALPALLLGDHVLMSGPRGIGKRTAALLSAAANVLALSSSLELDTEDTEVARAQAGMPRLSGASEGEEEEAGASRPEAAPKASSESSIEDAHAKVEETSDGENEKGRRTASSAEDASSGTTVPAHFAPRALIVVASYPEVLATAHWLSTVFGPECFASYTFQKDDAALRLLVDTGAEQERSRLAGDSHIRHDYHPWELGQSLLTVPPLSTTPLPPWPFYTDTLAPPAGAGLVPLQDPTQAVLSGPPPTPAPALEELAALVQDVSLPDPISRNGEESREAGHERGKEVGRQRRRSPELDSERGEVDSGTQRTSRSCHHRHRRERDSSASEEDEDRHSRRRARRSSDSTLPHDRSRRDHHESRRGDRSTTCREDFGHHRHRRHHHHSRDLESREASRSAAVAEACCADVTHRSHHRHHSRHHRSRSRDRSGYRDESPTRHRHHHRHHHTRRSHRDGRKKESRSPSSASTASTASATSPQLEVEHIPSESTSRAVDAVPPPTAEELLALALDPAMTPEGCAMNASNVATTDAADAETGERGPVTAGSGAPPEEVAPLPIPSSEAALPAMLRHRIPLLITTYTALHTALELVKGEASALPPLEHVRVALLSNLERTLMPPLKESFSHAWWLSVVNALDVECQFIMTSERMTGEVRGFLESTLLPDAGERLVHLSQRDASVWAIMNVQVYPVPVEAAVTAAPEQSTPNAAAGTRGGRPRITGGDIDASKIKHLLSIVTEHMSLPGVGESAATAATIAARVVMVCSARREQSFVVQELQRCLHDQSQGEGGAVEMLRVTDSVELFRAAGAEVLVLTDTQLTDVRVLRELHQCTDIDLILHFSLPRPVMQKLDKWEIVDVLAQRGRAILGYSKPFCARRWWRRRRPAFSSAFDNSERLAPAQKVAGLLLLTEHNMKGRAGSSVVEALNEVNEA